MNLDKLKILLLESSALEEIGHLLDQPAWTVLEQMEAHKADFLKMCRESIRKDPMTPDEMLGPCFEDFCHLLDELKARL